LTQVGRQTVEAGAAHPACTTQLVTALRLRRRPPDACRGCAPGRPGRRV
jgi:hypothetical protein